VVTGGANGIGRAAALRLAAQGARVLIADIRDQEAEGVTHAIRSTGGIASWVHCDVADESSVAAAFAQATRDYGHVEVLVGVAGIIDVGATHDFDLAAWERIVRVNLTGMFLACKYALREFLENGGGSIVTVGSVAAMVGRRGGSAAGYGAAKAGVVQLTRSIAVNYADSGVRANCVCPGSVQTDLNTHSNIATADFDRSKWFAAPIPGRADPDEIAGAIAFLASDDASFITGATLMVDGGMTAM
jgi:NAD(P)-dependent dehydrogenase (short-subunit alcohol dehydrogenase family)